VPDPADETFVKTRADAPADFFAWEAAGLGWLAEGARCGGAQVVGVREFDERRIVLEKIHQAPATARAAENFGHALAHTHKLGAAAFGAGPPGWSGDGYIGRQRLTLQPFSQWGEFYARTRLLPYAHAARQIGTLSAAALTAVERVCERLLAGEFDDRRPPARIHGDLWGGNLLYGPRGAVLIDPAAHGGHGLTDVAMLELFGTQHLDRVQAGYAESAGLAAGWRELIGLHQLHPVLVHAVSHGPPYGAHAHRIAEKYAGRGA
jgi:fructosamine-3-kinase